MQSHHVFQRCWQLTLWFRLCYEPIMQLTICVLNWLIFFCVGIYCIFAPSNDCNPSLSCEQLYPSTLTITRTNVFKMFRKSARFPIWVLLSFYRSECSFHLVFFTLPWYHYLQYYKKTVGDNKKYWEVFILLIVILILCTKIIEIQQSLFL